MEYSWMLGVLTPNSGIDRYRFIEFNRFNRDNSGIIIMGYTRPVTLH
jgi:hypothetical protein